MGWFSRARSRSSNAKQLEQGVVVEYSLADASELAGGFDMVSDLEDELIAAIEVAGA